MEFVFQSAKILSIASFFFYGVRCLFFADMSEEFERYGLTRFRKLTGALELAGALGITAGYIFPPLVIAASGGLSLLMLLGIFTRIRVGDPVTSMVPALALLLVNMFIAGYAVVGASGT